MSRLRALALAFAPGVGPKKYAELVAQFGTAAQAFDATVHARHATLALGTASDALTHALAAGAALLLLGDETYPPRLLELPDPPPFLFTRGDLGLLARPVIAVVGTRDATPYGERVTRRVAGALAAAGACVLSGMARGIDAVAHFAALEAGGATAAVLGCGVDIPYPRAHRVLHERIARGGLLLSEFRCGEPPNKGSFPRRNRIIAGLASATIVVEAGHRSGALLTSGYALDLGRAVAAVPGPMDAAQSVGANHLLRDGAIVIAAVADALALAGMPPIQSVDRAVLVGDERTVWDLLARGPQHVDALAAASDLPPRRCLAALTALELVGRVAVDATGAFARAGER